MTAIHNAYATTRPPIAKLSPQRPNLKMSNSLNGNSGAKLMSALQQLARGQNTSIGQPKPTPAQLHEFFTNLNPQNCNVHSGTFSLKHVYNRGFDGAFKVKTSQVIKK